MRLSWSGVGSADTPSESNHAWARTFRERECGAVRAVTGRSQRGAMLDAESLRKQLLAVQQCTTREGLNRLTRLLWRQFDTPANAKALAQLRARIEAQRATLDRNDPR